MGSPGWTYPVYEPHPTPARPSPPKEPPAADKALVDIYQADRELGDRLERFLDEIAKDGDWSDDDRKRLDKAAVVIKVGFKIVKKVLRARGWRELKPASMRDAA